MNKFIIGLFVFCAVIALSACGKKDDSAPPLMFEGSVADETAYIEVMGSKNTTTDYQITYAQVTTSTATTTFTYDSSFRFDMFDLTVCAEASSTLSQIKWEYGFGNSTTTIAGSRETSSSGNAVTLNSATTTYDFVPGAADEMECAQHQVTDLNSRYVQFKFFRGKKYENLNVFADVVFKNRD